MSVFQSGARALITGGASGIGLAVAEFCVKSGMRVSIIDFNQETLGLAGKNLQGDVQFIHADVSSADDWKRIREEVKDVDFLMLNAGVTGQGTWGDEAYFQKILNTNLFGVIHGLNTYVPSFKSRNEDASPAAIVITGSKQGITNPPGNPAYNASKAAVKTLAEHLSFDLKDKKNVDVHLLVPGWTFTGLSGNTPGSSNPQKPAGAWTPSQVSSYMLDKMKAGAFYIICPDNDVSEAMDRKRILWSAGDVVEGRPPLTRWRAEFEGEVREWMEKK
ncbi:NAD(P)-binding protein [Periconia macrospinosa]|uniref:NAD(P)-binding protein n=1 Tax=Periconia macrospinosa TaxID=97972 RepID=A0A2V1DSX4_9PLEO|nr:NAD(P)-binding protein [Periconia macrospinosa]